MQFELYKQTSAMSAQTFLLLIITMCASMQEGLGLPLNEQPDKESSGAPASRVRTKRCACNNQLDSECHYFCHLDIIWVNTPSKTIVYGLGSPLTRRRRFTGRCACANSEDRQCAFFCFDSFSSPQHTLKRTQVNLLSMLRGVASVFKRVLEAALPHAEKAADAPRPEGQ
ncbi:uncharacterized protein FYW47_006231 [Aplochiton taeniatus]